MLNMKMKNYEIIQHLNELNKVFSSENTTLFPINFIFYIKKNIKILLTYAKEIDECKYEIGEKFGEYKEEENAFLIIDNDSRVQAQEELNALFNIEQDVPIVLINVNDYFDKINLTTSQMEAILFMLKEE